jgi:glycosyltransferase involved in cell wall biosynthesis
MPATEEPPSPADVTVVIPVHNRAGVLARALDSVRAQTLPPADVVVVDDGSSDDTADVARAAGATVLRHPQSRGSGEARNTGIRAATTRWIAFLDSDDEWAPDHLRTLLPAAPGHAFVTSVTIDNFGRARGNTSGSPRLITPEDLFFPENIVCTSTVVADREAVLAAGMFRPLARAQDLDLWIRLLQHGPGLALPQATGTYHVPDAYTASGLRERSKAGRAVVLETYQDEPWMTRRLRRDLAAQGRWDDLRHAVHHREWRRSGSSLARLALSPRAVPAVLATVRHRRRGRSAARPAAAEVAATGSTTD